MYLKNSIIKMVNEIDDERFLEAVKAMLQNYHQSHSENSNVLSEPVNKDDYRKHIQQIIKEIEAGESISHEDLKKESESW
ncbi:MAG: hypothetical protein SFW35_07325 [Chitinophagales bacterium]|nr:hypothetical protein [Chitinophagales bacterium]